jgi:hypothetical protein
MNDKFHKLSDIGIVLSTIAVAGRAFGAGSVCFFTFKWTTTNKHNDKNLASLHHYRVTRVVEGHCACHWEMCTLFLSGP